MKVKQLTINDFDAGNVRLDSLRKRHFGLLWLAFMVTIVVGIVFGATAPNPFERDSLSSGTVDITHEDSTCQIDGKVVKNCFRHGFQFHHIWTQVFSLEFEVVPKNVLVDGEVKNIDLHFIWEGTHEHQRDELDAAEWETIVERDITRQVTCTTEEGCTKATVFKSTSVDYAIYIFTMQAMMSAEELEWIDHIDFTFVYRNYKYGMYEFMFKSIFAAVSLVAAMYFIYKTKISLYEQKWVAALFVSLVAFNNPIYFMEYVFPRDVVGWVDAIFQATFFAMLMLYWLVTFDGLRQDPPFDFKTFYLPKMVFVGVIYAVGLIAYLYVQFLEANDKLYNWFDDKGILDFLGIFGTLSTIVYLGWLGFILFKGFADLKSFAAKQRVIYYFHLFAALVIMTSAVGFGTFGGSGSMADEGDMIFFHFVFNAYLLILAFLYSPVGSSEMSATDLSERTPMFNKKGDANVVPIEFGAHKNVSDLVDSSNESSPIVRSRTPRQVAVV